MTSSKRNRDPLGPKVHAERSRKVLSFKNYHLQKRARDDSVETFVSNQSKARAAVEARIELQQQAQECVGAAVPEEEKNDENVLIEQKKPKQQSDRRYAIKYAFEYIYGSMSVDRWKETGLVTSIMTRLCIPNGSYASVRSVLLEVVGAFQNNTAYDAKKGERRRGRKALITDESPEAEVIFRALETNISTLNVAVLVNEFRNGQQPPRPPVSFSAVERFVLKSPIIDRTRRRTQKTGKTDADSTWAKARVEQCSQFSEQFRLGMLPAGDPELYHPALPPVYLHALIVFDENHKKCILGHSSKVENRIARNPFDGAPTDPAFGGVLPPKKDRTKPKYEKEARGCFGVAVKQLVDGTKVGARTSVFNYTERKVVGVKNYNTAIKAELKRVSPLLGVWRHADYGYEERYPLTWEAEVKKVVDKKLCNIKDIIDFMIREGNKIYEGTAHADSYFIYHDALSQFWEKDAVQYMHEIGVYDRLLRCRGDTNRGTRYYQKVVGDSPELCRGLDAYCFSDHKRSMGFHTSLTSICNINDVSRFKTGTPAEMFSTMERCWTVEPTSHRIVEDILGFPDVLDKIIAHNGTVLHADDLRRGRRYERHDHAGELKGKPRGRQRVNTMTGRPVHPDAMGAYNRLLGAANPQQANAVVEQLADVFHELEMEGQDDNDLGGDNSSDGNSDQENEN